MTLCICAVAFTSKTMAQTFNYTDASGVTCTYEATTYNSIDVVHLTAIVSIPSSVTKWVLPETIVEGGITYQVAKIGAYGVWDEYNLKSASLEEIVLPKYMYHCDARMSTTTFPNLHKITFGEDMVLYPNTYIPFDTIIFKGIGVIFSDGSLINFFKDCPSTTKIIIPCGTMNAFTTAFEHQLTTWNADNGWTVANFVEAECLNTITVLSNDVNLGNAISTSGCGTLTTTTPDNTTATFSGTATLYALVKVDKVFTGWSDGNTDNPRTVTVASDTTFTANFASCKETGIMGTQSENSFKAFPNPANNTLNVELKNYVNNGTLTLFDMNGKLVLSQTISGNSAQINMSSLSAGNYILRLVENGTASAGVQVIKQ